MANLAENEKLYDDASNFRKMAMECYRRENIFRRILPISLHWWYWLSSSYDESWRKALSVFLLLLGSIAFIYTKADFYVCDQIDSKNCQVKTLDLTEAIKQSLATAVFQKVETRKPVGSTELIIYLEMVFVPLQAALLALAIRRKFQR